MGLGLATQKLGKIGDSFGAGDFYALIGLRLLAMSSFVCICISSAIFGCGRRSLSRSNRAIPNVHSFLI
jgi:hypothetical protein